MLFDRMMGLACFETSCTTWLFQPELFCFAKFDTIHHVLKRIRIIQKATAILFELEGL